MHIFSRPLCIVSGKHTQRFSSVISNSVCYTVVRGLRLVREMFSSGRELLEQTEYYFRVDTEKHQSAVAKTEGVTSTVFDRSLFGYDIGLLCCVCNSVH